MGRHDLSSDMLASRRKFLLSTGAAGLSLAVGGGAARATAAEEEFTLSFNVTKGLLGIRLQELRYPRQSGFFGGGKTFEAVIVSSVDPAGQGVTQAKGRVRPGLVVKAVQGRKLMGLKAKDAIKQVWREGEGEGGGEEEGKY